MSAVTGSTCYAANNSRVDADQCPCRVLSDQRVQEPFSVWFGQKSMTCTRTGHSRTVPVKVRRLSPVSAVSRASRM